MVRRRSLVLTALIALIALVAAACGGGGGGGEKAKGPVTLNLWAYEGYQDYLPVLQKAFEKKYPNIHLQITNVPEEQYTTKVDTSLAASDPPDLGFVYDRKWLKGGKFLPLDDMVKAQHIDLSTWAPGIVGQARGNSEYPCAFDGKVYCLGSYTGTVQVFYNKDMFDAAGIPYPKPWPAMTLDQYIDTACKLTNKAKKVWGTANGDPLTWLPWEVAVTPDGRKFTGVINSPSTAHVYEQVAGMMQKGCAPSLNVLDPWQQGVDFFSQKKLAMVITDFQSLFKIEKAGINYGVTAPPAPQGLQSFSNEWTDGIGVFKDSKHPEEAKQFVAFQATEGQRLRVQVTGDVPVSTAVAQQMNWAHGIPGREEALQALPHARPNFFVPSRWDIVGPLFDAFGLIVDGKPAQQELDAAAPKVQANLDKAWKTWEEF